MNIRTPKKDLSEPKILKVSLPANLHVQLHSHKILEGQPISKTIEKALERYLEETIGRSKRQQPHASGVEAATQG